MREVRACTEPSRPCGGKGRGAKSQSPQCGVDRSHGGAQWNKSAPRYLIWDTPRRKFTTIRACVHAQLRRASCLSAPSTQAYSVPLTQGHSSPTQFSQAQFVRVPYRAAATRKRIGSGCRQYKKKSTFVEEVDFLNVVYLTVDCACVA